MRHGSFRPMPEPWHIGAAEELEVTNIVYERDRTKSRKRPITKQPSSVIVNRPPILHR